MKSNSCFSKKTGEPLSVYVSENDALNGAMLTRINGGPDFYPYQCDKCGYYHLAPENSRINVKRNACHCRDSNGKPKALYLSKEDAEKQRLKSQEEQHIKLKVYRCDEGLGFHLTHCL